MKKILLLLLLIISTLQITYATDTDWDWIKDEEYNTVYNATITKIKDNEINTTPENISYICTVSDVEDWLYNCLQLNTIWKFSQEKKDTLTSQNTDTDWDWIYDNEYELSVNWSLTKVKDNEINTTPENIPYICTLSNIENRDYNCITKYFLWKFSQEKKDYILYWWDRDKDWIKDEEDKEETIFNDSYINIPELYSSIKPIFRNGYQINISKITAYWEYVIRDSWEKIDSREIKNSQEEANWWYYRNFALEDISVPDESKLLNYICTKQDVSTWTTDNCITSNDKFPIENDSACCNTTSNLWKFSWNLAKISAANLILFRLLPKNRPKTLHFLGSL